MSDIEQIEIGIKEIKELIEKKNAVSRLMANRDFKKVFVEGYFKEEPSRLVGLLAEPSAAQYREEIIRSMDGVAQAKLFIRTIVQMGNTAERELAEHEQLLESRLNDEE